MTGNKFKRNKSRKDKKFVQQRLPKLKTFLCANYENSPLFEFLPNCQKITRYRLNLKFLNSFLQHQHKLFSFFLLSSWSNVWLIEHSNFPAVWDIDYTRLIICQALISHQNWISTTHSLMSGFSVLLLLFDHSLLKQVSWTRFVCGLSFSYMLQLSSFTLNSSYCLRVRSHLQL